MFKLYDSNVTIIVIGNYVMVKTSVDIEIFYFLLVFALFSGWLRTVFADPKKLVIGKMKMGQLRFWQALLKNETSQIVITLFQHERISSEILY